MSLLANSSVSFSTLLCISLAHFLWQGAAIVVMAVVLGKAFGRFSARAEYVILAAGLIVLPIAFAGTLAWETLTPSASSVARPAWQPPALSASAGPSLSLPIANAETAMPAPSAAIAANGDWRVIAPWLSTVYLSGVFVMGLRLLVGLRGGRKLCREAVPVTEGWMLELLVRQCRRMAMRSVPAIAICREVTVPTLIGVLRPTILLPLAAATGLMPVELESILLHELAHIRRYDYLLNIVPTLD